MLPGCRGWWWQRWRWNNGLHRWLYSDSGLHGRSHGNTGLHGRHQCEQGLYCWNSSRLECFMKQRQAGRLIGEILSGSVMAEAARMPLSPAEGESLADWAVYFNVAGLLYRELKSPAEFIPTHARNRLRDAYRHNAILNTAFFGDAAKVIKVLADHDIPVIALKGYALAKSLYGDLGLRPMSDLDFLVKEEHLVQAGRLLMAHGYTPACATWDGAVKAHHHLPPFTNPRGTRIELHWALVDPGSPIHIDGDGLWERSVLVQEGDVEFRVLSPEDTCLHLCIHAALHLQTGLGLMPLCDIAGLIRTSAGALDWQVLSARAAQWNSGRCVYLTLLMVREWSRVSAPEDRLHAMRPDDFRTAYLKAAMEQILEVRPSGQLVGVRISLQKLDHVNGIRGKVRALVRYAWPEKEELARQYAVSRSSPKIYLCYARRTGHLLVYGARMLPLLFRRDQSLVKGVRLVYRGTAVSNWMLPQRECPELKPGE